MITLRRLRKNNAKGDLSVSSRIAKMLKAISILRAQSKWN
jgi:hypothetical protein